MLEQRIGRAHRMGQKNPVHVYLLVTEETLEELAMRAHEDFTAHGGEDLRLVPSLNSEEVWVDAVIEILGSPMGVRGRGGDRSSIGRRPLPASTLSGARN